MTARAGTGRSSALPPGGEAVPSPVPGSVWKLSAEAGRPVSAGDPLLIVESMKMEITIRAPTDGILAELRCAEGRAVGMGQVLAVLLEDTI